MVATTTGIITHYIGHQIEVETKDFIGIIYEAGANQTVIPRIKANEVLI